MTPQYTCITCRVGFREAELQRDHYKTDWHRYNLKRKVAEMEPVTSEEFEKKVLQHRAMDENQGKSTVEHCKPCCKNFNTKNAYVNHINSKKHKVAEERILSQQQSQEEDFVVVDHRMLKEQPQAETEHIETDSEFEEVDSDEWEDYDEEAEGRGSLFKPSECLFCDHHSQNTVKNLTHMTVSHSFFIPDVEYCIDIMGMLNYLGEKISRGYMCLWCNDRGRAFRSQEAAQAHMRDKGHCKVLHEGTALAEYTDFYDYSSSYPDHEPGDETMEVDTEEETVLQPSTLDDEEYQLVLPSGSVIGHRSLFRYYKQNLSHGTEVVVHKKEDKLRRVLRQYRMLGYAPQQTEATARKARDIQYMKRVQAKWSSQLGIKANKLQKHFRVQSNF